MKTRAEINARRRIHQPGCSRSHFSCTCREDAALPPPPIVCCCRRDSDGYRWYNLGCRLHTRLWSPAWTYDRLHKGTALVGTHLPQPARRQPQ